MDEATKNFLKNAKPRKRTAQNTDINPATVLHDLNSRPEPPQFHLVETKLTSQDHLALYRDLLQRNANSLNQIVRLRRMIEGTEDGDALGLAVKIINGLSNTSSSRSLVEAYQSSLK